MQPLAKGSLSYSAPLLFAYRIASCVPGDGTGKAVICTAKGVAYGCPGGGFSAPPVGEWPGSSREGRPPVEGPGAQVSGALIDHLWQSTLFGVAIG